MELDDLLGDSPSGAETVAATAGKGEGGEGTVQSAETPTNLKIPKPRRLPAKGPPPPRVHPVQLTHIKDPPPHVKPYVTNACYYANQVSIVSCDGTRSKRGIVVNDSNIYIMTDDSRMERTVPLTQLEALVKQDVASTKSFGMAKEWQTHVVLQLRDMPDVFFALSEDRKKDPATGSSYGEKIPSLEKVLEALLQSYDVDLLVCVLKDGESIQHLIKWTVTDTLLRRESEELLAYRTSLEAELQNLARHESRLITMRNDIEASGASRSVASLLKEIQILEGKKETVQSALRQANHSLANCREKESALRASLAAKANERQTLASDCIAGRQGEIIAQRALEYEHMKIAHEGDMRRLKLLLAFLQPRAERCRKSSTPSAADLQADFVELARLKKRVMARKEATTEALTEAKRRLADSKAAIKQVTKEVELLQQLQANVPIPDAFDRTLAPALLPVRLPDEEEEEERGDRQGQTQQQKTNSVQAVNQTTGVKSAVLLDDDDDDDDIDLVPPRRQQAANTKPAFTIIDDDDL